MYLFLLPVLNTSIKNRLVRIFAFFLWTGIAIEVGMYATSEVQVDPAESVNLTARLGFNGLYQDTSAANYRIFYSIEDDGPYHLKLPVSNPKIRDFKKGMATCGFIIVVNQSKTELYDVHLKSTWKLEADDIPNFKTVSLSSEQDIDVGDLAAGEERVIYMKNESKYKIRSEWPVTANFRLPGSQTTFTKVLNHKAAGTQLENVMKDLFLLLNPGK